MEYAILELLGDKEHKGCTMTSPKQAAKALIEHLPEQASWNDIMYELYVKQKIEAGLKAVTEGRAAPHEEVKRRLLDKKRRT